MKHICELNKKGFAKNLPKILDAVKDPAYICHKCARVSNNNKRLCKPISIESIIEKSN